MAEQDLLVPEILDVRGADPSGPYAGSSSFHVKVRRRLPNFLNSVNLKHVRLGYHYLISHKLYFTAAAPVLLAVILGAVEYRALARSGELAWSAHGAASLGFVLVLLIVAVYVYLDLRPCPTYLVDFACFRPPEDLQITRAEFIDLVKRSGNFNQEAIEYQQRVLKNSGIGDESYMPRSVFKPSAERVVLREGREEAAMVMFGAIDDLLAATGVNPRDIRILVVNCGVLNTTPSLSAMVINHYRLRRDIVSFNLGGMGCAAGVIAVDLARDLLWAYPGTYALVVSTEVVSSTWYAGNDLDMLAPNCFFRMGAAAVLMSSRHLDRWRSKYELRHVVRTHRGADERSFRSVELREDKEGKLGLRVGRRDEGLMEVGGHALKANMATLGPLVLPVKEQLNFLKALARRKDGAGGGELYMPDYKEAFEHVCVQAASGRVAEEVQRNLGLTEGYMEATRRALGRLGNTSSSMVWYELAFLEAEGRVKGGDRVWQVALGSGFKCNSMVWRALRSVTRPARSPWVGFGGRPAADDRRSDRPQNQHGQSSSVRE